MRHLLPDMGSPLKDFSFGEAVTKQERAKGGSYGAGPNLACVPPPTVKLL